MLSQRERIEEIHRRSAERSKKQRRMRAAMLGTVSVGVSLAMIIALAFWIPGIVEREMTGEALDYSGSMFTDSPVLGFIIIGILAFILGILVTLLCHYLHRRVEDPVSEDYD